MTTISAGEVDAAALDRAAASVGEAAAAAAEGAVALQLDDVDKRYPGVHALKGVTLAVHRGDVHALVGENGAGKSTLVGVASGTVIADRGTVAIGGATLEHPTPAAARERGLAIVHQEPALLPDLTVAENMRLGMPAHARPSVSEQQRWAAALLEPWRSSAQISPATYVRDLRPDERFVVEIARALAENPSVLILDEPTEHLLPEGVAQLFEQIKAVVARGTAVVYISHRIHEVKQVASTISVLRDGSLQGTFAAAEIDEGDIIDLIVGRRLHARFPGKADQADLGDPVLVVDGLDGVGHSDVSLSVRRGEIVGLAGIDGHGQRETMRALAGLTRSTGRVEVNGRRASLRTTWSARRSGIAYLPNDRHVEGVLPRLSVRENVTISAIGQLSSGGVVQPRKERRAIRQEIDAYDIKTPSPEADIDALSGGNQQKVMLSRVLLTRSSVILADEPTQGVDVGARAEIYKILRTAAQQGAAVVVVSSDAAELEGLCDRVLVFSSGRTVRELTGTDVTEWQITQSALTATAQRARGGRPRALSSRPRRLAQSDLAPSLVLALAIVVLGVIATAHSDFYLTTRNFGLVLPLLGILAFVSLAQQLVMMVGGIDLSVGPLMGLIVVLASFGLSPERSVGGLAAGWALIVAVAVTVGVANWLLVTIGRVNAVVATLVTYTAIQGVSLLLRPTPGGEFADSVTSAAESKIGFVPMLVIVAVAVALLLEIGLRRTLVGVRLRGVGSNADVARKVGVRSKRVLLGAYVGCSLLAAVAAVALLPQVGSGNAAAGTTYTLASIGAVVLGGASVFGGRGSFLGALLGAALIIQINTVVQFLELSDYWQQFMLGGLTVLAAAFYSKSRSISARTG